MMHQIPSIQPDQRRASWEEIEKQKILAMLAEKRKEYLKHVRKQLAILYRLRAHVNPVDAYVCSDDAREILEEIPGIPPPEILSRTFLGATFKSKDWRTDGGMVKSRTPGNHARLQFKWELK